MPAKTFAADLHRSLQQLKGNHMCRSIPVLMALSLLVLAGCTQSSDEQSAQQRPPPPAERAEPASSLLGIEWQWISTITPVERTEARDPERYTLRLQADGAAVMRFDCNRGSGSYELAENRITFGPLISTRMACPPDTQDSVFMGQLQKVSSYFVREGELFLEMPYDSGTMRFRPASSPD